MENFTVVRNNAQFHLVNAELQLFIVKDGKDNYAIAGSLVAKDSGQVFQFFRQPSKPMIVPETQQYIVDGSRFDVCPGVPDTFNIKGLVVLQNVKFVDDVNLHKA